MMFMILALMGAIHAAGCHVEEWSKLFYTQLELVRVGLVLARYIESIQGIG